MRLEWQRERNEFNHDWLRNRYLLALGRWINLLAGAIEDEALESSFVASVLPEWEHRRDQAICLAQRFEASMSPRNCVIRGPLAEAEPSTSEWLGRLVHVLWLTRYPVSDWVGGVIRATRKADFVYGQLHSALRECGNTQSALVMAGCRSEFEQFRDSCLLLAEAIAKFPHGIRL